MRGKWNGEGKLEGSGMTMKGHVGATRKSEKLSPELAAFLSPARKGRKARKASPRRPSPRKARK